MARTDIASLPFSFIPNTGQIADRNISFTVRGSGSTLYFTPGEVIVDNVKNSGLNGTAGPIRQSFPGANPHPTITGVDELPGKVNYLIGSDPSGWRSNISTYGSVIYHDLYPGIDLRYFGNEGYLKREFHIAPGADPGRIAFRYDGITGIIVDGDGSLNITTSHGMFRESPPFSYQEIVGRRVNVTVRYSVTGPDSARMVTGAYDPTYPLVIDPKLGYSTYYGGSSADGGTPTSIRGEVVDQRDAIAVNATGYVYATGYTASTDFRTSNALYPSYSGSQDAFVLELNRGGSSPVWATYLGGTGQDVGDAIAVDAGGNVTVTGYTDSANFPTTSGAFNQTRIGSTDAFVAKLKPDGSALIFSTYYGGTDQDFPEGLAMDTAMNVYIAGGTFSGDFYTTPGAINATNNAGSGTDEAFIVKLKPDGSAPVYSTYYGGTSESDLHSIAVDSEGDAYVTGHTTAADFPTSAGSFQPSRRGGEEAVVVKLNPSGTTVNFSTYFGGTNNEYGNSIAVNDATRNVYFTGQTTSTNLVTTAGAANTTKIGGTTTSTDAFVAELNPAGSALVYSTYYGGTQDDFGTAIVLDQNAIAHIAGYTKSGDFRVTSDAYQNVSGNGIAGGGNDVFLLRLNFDGSAPVYATYFGGSADDYGYGIALDPDGNAYVVGSTSSNNFPTTIGAANSSGVIGGTNNADAFIFKFFLNSPVPDFIANTTFGYAPQGIQFNDTSTSFAIQYWNWSFGDNTWFNTTDSSIRNISHTYTNIGSYTVNLTITNVTTDDTKVRLNYINISAPPPLPAFTSNITFGYVPQGVQFNDTTQSINIQYWNWSFGDNLWFNTTDITTRNVTHTYSSSGSYTVNLSVTNTTGLSTPFTNTNTTSIANYINISARIPIPAFTSNITFGYVPQGVQFNDTTLTTNVQYWNWSFGDNIWFNTTDINARNTTHTYLSSGSYTVNLSVTNTTGLSTPFTNTNTTSIANYINISAGIPIPAFTGTPTSGNFPLDVQFNDTTLSTNILYWNWSFGDTHWFNTTSAAARNATHTYSSAGSFTVNLSVTNTTGLSTPFTNTNMTSRLNYITSVALPFPDFTGSPRSGNATLKVQFNDTSLSPGVTMWNWSFGDNTWFNTTSVAARNTTHPYSAEGSYSVSLSLTNSSGTNSTSRSGYILVGPPLPVPDFMGSPTTGNPPLDVQFNDTSPSPGITQWNWSFGDNSWFNTTGSVFRNATHTYSTIGTFTVNLTVTNSTGVNTTSRSGYISTTPPPPLPLFTGSPVSGVAPLLVQFTDLSTSPGLTMWNWSFGDGHWFNTTDTAQRNAQYTYESGGSYTVNLSLTNSSGTNMTSRSGYISVTALPNGVDFSATPTSGIIPLIVQFTDLSTAPGIIMWNWSFGDGHWFNTTDTSQRNAQYTYVDAGSYRVNLSVTNSSGTNTTSKFGFITASNPTTTTPTPGSSGSGGGGGSSPSWYVPAQQTPLVLSTAAPQATLAIPPVKPPSYHIQTTTTCLLPEGLRFPPLSDGMQPFLFDRVKAEHAGYTVEIKGNSVTATRSNNLLVIDATNIQESGSGLITGSVQNVYFVVQPDPLDVNIGGVTITGEASLPTLPEYICMNITISDLVPNQTLNSFQLTAAQWDREISAVGFTATFRKDGISSTGPGIIRMTCPPEWVDNHGGNPAIGIVRIGDDKLTELLPTTYTGTDESGNRAFEAPTPHGFSIFGLVALKSRTGEAVQNLTPVPIENQNNLGFLSLLTPEGGAAYWVTIFGCFAMIVIVLFVVWKRWKKYDWLFMR
nr:PKD domain-containing protein [uncultured Methanoregula sp.]